MNLLIEGDNGTGKDTLATGLQGQSFDIITYHEEIQHQIDRARTFRGAEHVLKFLDYNASCGRLMEEASCKNTDTITIRYWPSTLAAAYADRKLSESECDTLADICTKTFPLPDLVIFLVCDHNERVHRIVLRNSPNFDDKSIERAGRYAYYSDKITEKLGDIVCRVNTGGKSREEICTEVQGLIYQRRIRYERAG